LHRENDAEQEQNPAEDQFEFGGHGFLVFTFKLGGHAPHSERRRLSNVRFAEVRIQGLDHIQRECLPQDAVPARAARIELPHDPSRRATGGLAVEFPKVLSGACSLECVGISHAQFMEKMSNQGDAGDIPPIPTKAVKMEPREAGHGRF
jgi:hypothetical protein